MPTAQPVSGAFWERTAALQTVMTSAMAAHKPQAGLQRAALQLLGECPCQRLPRRQQRDHSCMLQVPLRALRGIAAAAGAPQTSHEMRRRSWTMALDLVDKLQHRGEAGRETIAAVLTVHMADVYYKI